MATLAGTEARRAGAAVEAGAVDPARFAHLLDIEGLLPLLGNRLLEFAPDALPDWFAGAVAARHGDYHQYGVLLEIVTDSVVEALASAGVAAVPLKGPRLARALYGDVGMRRTSDLDLLVDPGRFQDACDVLADLGWTSDASDAPWCDGLPLFETTLSRRVGPVANIDLHWRLHWRASAFSREIMQTSASGAREQHLDLAALLVIWARDGFWGMRYGADIAAWWDRHGPAQPAACLDPVVTAYPELEPTLAVAAIVADRLVGVPAGALLDERRLARYRTSRATRMACWADLRSPAARWTSLGKRKAQRTTQVALADWLLAEPGGRGAVIRRHVLVPRPVLAGIYGHDEASTVRHILARSRYTLAVGGALTLRGMAALWRLRKYAPSPSVGTV